MNKDARDLLLISKKKDKDLNSNNNTMILKTTKVSCFFTREKCQVLNIKRRKGELHIERNMISRKEKRGRQVEPPEEERT